MLNAQERRDGTKSSFPAWRLGLLAPAGCALAILPAIPDLVFLAPAAGLATLPAFAEMPLFSYALFVPPLLDNQGFVWPVILIFLGSGLCLFSRTDKGLTHWPLLLLGLTLSARAGGLADSALAGSEALILALALAGRDSRAILFRTPLPPLAGFLPFWLGLHVVNGLSGLSPVWTAASMILSLLIGVLMVRAWLCAWSHVSPALTLTDRGLIPALTLGLCLSICPGLLLGLVHVTALDLAGAGPEIWRAWPIWSVAGGDGAFWYPALVFLVPALIAPAIMSQRATALKPLPSWPSPELKPRLAWGVKRLLAKGRCAGLSLRKRLSRFMKEPTDGLSGSLSSKTPIALARQTLSLWLVLLAAALAWLGWST